MWDVNNRMREGVIIMKNNKKGFSLAEVMIVVAIMVILTGATAVGIVSWLNSAKSTAANLEQNNGDHFEESAINEIKKIAGTAGSHVVQQTKVNTPAVTQAPEVTEAPKTTDAPEVTEAPKTTEAPRTTDAPEVTEAPKTTEAPRTTDAPNQQGGNGGSGSVSVGGTVTQNGSSVGISNFTNNADGSTTLHFVNGNDVGDATIGKDSKGYYLIVGDQKNMIGKVLGYNPENKWLNSNEKLYIPSSQWSQLESTFNFSRN